MEPEPFLDNRGMFARIFCANDLAEIGLHSPLVQINHSRNAAPGTVRGMHFQHPPKAETKIVKCILGTIFDVIVDIRRNSFTFLQWHGVQLSAENMRAVYIPPGFAHGFQVLEAKSELLYLHTEYYSPEHEDGFSPTDLRIGITWPLDISLLSDRDRALPSLEQDFQGI